MKNLIDYAYQDNGTDFRKELYGAIHDKVAAAIENKKQEIAAGFMGQQEESYEDEGESLDEAISIPVFPDTHKKAKSNGVDTVHTTKTPVGERPKGIGWSLHRSGQQHNEPHDVWKSTSRKVAKHTGLGESLDEAKKPEFQVYHPSYSSAVQNAEKHLNAQGFEIHPDDWFHHVNSGPTKPAEGKTVSLHIPLHKNGIPSKKVAHIQVYNRGNDLANNHELNMYTN